MSVDAKTTSHPVREALLGLARQKFERGGWIIDDQQARPIQREMAIALVKKRANHRLDIQPTLGQLVLEVRRMLAVAALR